MLPPFAARRVVVVRRPAASEGYRGVFRPRVRVQHRHAGPRHPRRRQPPGGRAERVHRRHRVRDLPENHERGHRRAAGRRVAGRRALGGRAAGRRRDAVHRRRPHRRRARSRLARFLRLAAGRAAQALPRARFGQGRGGLAGFRRPARRPFRAFAPSRPGVARRRASAVGGHPPGYGARQGQERFDDRPFRRRGGFALLQERYFHGAFEACHAASRAFRAQAAQ